MPENQTLSKPTSAEQESGEGLSSSVLLAVNARIQKTAAKLKLKISNYEGYARGKWSTGDESPAPAGMWVFTVSPDDPSSTTDPEPMNVVAENITDALEQMESSAEYFFG
jgi:hypothetical protein